jgi:hypothetical protein
VSSRRAAVAAVPRPSRCWAPTAAAASGRRVADAARRPATNPEKFKLSKSFQKISTWLVVPSQLGAFSVRRAPPSLDLS